MNIEQLVKLIKQKHHHSGIEINPPATFSDIIEFENQIGFSLPPDFREFYLTCNGFGCDEDIFNIIPLQEIIESQQNFGNNWFYFSEYMIYSDMWGLRYTTTGQFEIFNDSYPDKILTSSLNEFLQRFLTGNIFDAGGLYEWHNEPRINNSNE